MVRSLLAWHDADPRFQEPAARARVALLYLPLVLVVLDNLDQLYDWGAAGEAIADAGRLSLIQKFTLNTTAARCLASHADGQLLPTLGRQQ